MGILTKVIATVATKVIAEMDRRSELAKTTHDMHMFCETNGYRVTEVMQNNPIGFMLTLRAAKATNKTPVIKYKVFHPYYDRDGRKCRTDWERTNNVITIHCGSDKF